MSERVIVRGASILSVKSISEDLREIEGIATSPEVDRVGDIVEPRGVRFKNPTVLLWAHDVTKPVGKVWFTPGTAEIRFKASLPKIEEPGKLRDRIEEAWQSIKARLITCVSIGFRSLEHEPLVGGGTRFIKSELIELSLVTIPAHPGAVITSVKSIDNQLHRLLGLDHSHRKRLDLAVAAGDFERVAELGSDPEAVKLLARSLAAGNKPGDAVTVGQFSNALAGSTEHSSALFRYASARVNALERRLTELAAGAGIELAKKETPYPRGSLVMDTQGGLWRALQDDDGTGSTLCEPGWRRVSLNTGARQ